jgi:hypothetical protein
MLVFYDPRSAGARVAGAKKVRQPEDDEAAEREEQRRRLTANRASLAAPARRTTLGSTDL